AGHARGEGDGDRPARRDPRAEPPHLDRRGPALRGLKIILSRKGSDASAGGGPSPILADGGIVSLPIPDRRSRIRYRDIVGVRDHAPHRDVRAHLDPDLDPAARPRPRGWRPVFGQEGAAQTVLARAGVGPGDVFVYFGWFRRGREDLHVLFGWL